MARNLTPRDKVASGDGSNGASCQEATMIDVKRGEDEGGKDGGGGGEGGGGRKGGEGELGQGRTDPTQELLLESLNFKLPCIQPALQSKGEE